MTKRIQNIFDIFDWINNEIPLETIKLTSGQLSLILQTPKDVMSMSFDQIKKAGDLINADYFSLYDDHFILSLYEDSYDELHENIYALRQVVVDMADIICACTGNEICIDKYQIKCYLDVREIDAEQFNRINELFEDTGLIIFDHRPYVVFNRDIIEDNIVIEEIGDD